jgi:hypothetical protein
MGSVPLMLGPAAAGDYFAAAPLNPAGYLPWAAASHLTNSSAEEIAGVGTGEILAQSVLRRTLSAPGSGSTFA